MLFVLGLIAACVLVALVALIGFSVVVAIATWVILKWLVILSAFAGGAIGFLLFHDQLAGLVGAALGATLSVGGLAFLAHRAEVQEEAERAAREEAERLAREEEIRRTAERRRQRYEVFTENPVGRFVKSLLE